MEITDVRIRRMDDEGKMKAVASVTFDGEFVVHDIKIVKGANGLFVAKHKGRICPYALLHRLPSIGIFAAYPFFLPSGGRRISARRSENRCRQKSDRAGSCKDPALSHGMDGARR